MRDNRLTSTWWPQPVICKTDSRVALLLGSLEAPSAVAASLASGAAPVRSITVAGSPWSRLRQTADATPPGCRDVQIRNVTKVVSSSWGQGSRCCWCFLPSPKLTSSAPTATKDLAMAHAATHTLCCSLLVTEVGSDSYEGPGHGARTHSAACKWGRTVVNRWGRRKI